MDELLKDWCDFCEGRRDFDKSHFFTLFMDSPGKEHFEKALSYFPNSSQLLSRLNDVLGFELSMNRKSKITDEDSLIIYANGLLEQSKACAAAVKADDLVVVLDTVRVRYVENYEVLQKTRSDNLWTSELVSQLGYYFSSQRISKEPKYYALFEAYYGVASRYEICWYLGRPLFDIKLDFDSFFELWSVGADYALTETELLVGVYDSTRFLT